MKQYLSLIRQSYINLADGWERYFLTTQIGLFCLFSLSILSSPFKYVLMFLIYSFLAVGTAEIYLKTLQAKNNEFKLLTKNYKSFLNFFITNLVKYIQIAFWSIFFVVPGIIKMIEFSFSTQILSQKPNQDAFLTLKQSKDLANGNKTKLFFVYLSCLLLCVFCLCFCGGVVLLVNSIFPVNKLTIQISIASMFLVLFTFFVLPYIKVLKSNIYLNLILDKKQKKSKNSFSN